MEQQNKPCVACGGLPCIEGEACGLAPYFSSEQGQRDFLVLDAMFGASNVSKDLQSIDPIIRQLLVENVVYESDCKLQLMVVRYARVFDSLQNQLNQVLETLERLKTELGTSTEPLKGLIDFNSMQQQVSGYVVRLQILIDLQRQDCLRMRESEDDKEMDFLKFYKDKLLQQEDFLTGQFMQKVLQQQSLEETSDCSRAVDLARRLLHLRVTGHEAAAAAADDDDDDETWRLLLG